tara:strand:- start:10 stop:195 length:186 start_codon:yes stop_codon:yes gene_type:complete
MKKVVRLFVFEEQFLRMRFIFDWEVLHVEVLEKPDFLVGAVESVRGRECRCAIGCGAATPF